MVRMLSLVFVYGFTQVTSGLTASNFEAAFTTWKHAYNRTTEGEPIYCASCVTEAELKSNQFASYTQAEKYAVTVVNLYTQDTEPPEYNINKVLNKQLRCGKLTLLMEEFKYLLDSAIDILSTRNVVEDSTLFHATRRCDKVGIGVSKIAAFISTTTDAKHSFELEHGNDTCSVFMVFKHATGLSVNEYSAKPSKNEILLKSGTVMNIKMLLNNKTDITAAIEKYWSQFSSSGQTVKLFVESDLNMNVIDREDCSSSMTTEHPDNTTPTPTKEASAATTAKYIPNSSYITYIVTSGSLLLLQIIINN